MKLNLGCGNDYRSSWHNVDILARYDPDEFVDLNRRPWPWDDDCAERVDMIDVLEHLDDVVGAMDEAWRVCVPDGRLTVRVPHHESPNAVIDPTHKQFFAPRTIEFFLRDNPYHDYTGRKWELLRSNVTHHDDGTPENIEWLLTPIKGEEP